MKLPLSIDLYRVVGEWKFNNGETGLRYSGGVNIATSEDIEEVRRSVDGAYISDADGEPLAWYSCCGSHMLTITPAFLEFLQGLKA